MQIATSTSASRIQSDNKGNGFFGRLTAQFGLSEAQAKEAFDGVARFLTSNGHASSPEDAAYFLDSREGRHFADVVQDFSHRDDGWSTDGVVRAVKMAWGSDKRWKSVILATSIARQVDNLRDTIR